MAVGLGTWALVSRTPDEGAPGQLSPLEAAARPYVGLHEDTIRERLGPPTFRLAEPPGEYWRYTVEACELDLFFYPADGAGSTVQHARYRPSHPATPPEACLHPSAGPDAPAD